MKNSEEVDLSKAKLIPCNDIILDVINQSLLTNFPDADLGEELRSCGYELEDLLVEEKITNFLKILNEKFPL